MRLKPNTAEVVRLDKWSLVLVIEVSIKFFDTFGIQY